MKCMVASLGEKTRPLKSLSTGPTTGSTGAATCLECPENFVVGIFKLGVEAAY